MCVCVCVCVYMCVCVCVYFFYLSIFNNVSIITCLIHVIAYHFRKSIDYQL